ncbi:MAG: large conductance mechanosensitive channel protein MscL [Isosphaeraceae bacterium]|nr:large conductance mechanosensitive channel protein MscL [Isosphaeraceae bacterium]
MKVAQLLQEFKKFALKGNVVDLALAVIIGGAFGKVITSLVDNVLMPVISYVSPKPEGYLSWHIGRIKIGAFLGDSVNFLIIAGAMFFLLVKLVGAIEKAVPWPKPDEPATKECPLCLSTIPYRATKCAHCTADLPQDTARTSSPPT